ncbi:MAG TPA: hypothetical protein DCM08_11420 [Microscillaceae bacterium]|jgi:serine/threonine protein kinase|nr:hypothetical protein [Microscillaceae bacterium]
MPVYPSIEDYKASFLDPGSYFKSLSLQFVPSTQNAFDPFFISGGLAVVFKVLRQGQPWAVKCFKEACPQRKAALDAIAKFLAQNPSPYFLPFEYYDDELWVCSAIAGDADYPIVMLPWVEAPTLGQYVADLVAQRKTQALQDLYESFLELAHYLLRSPLAHGDLKHDNILVKSSGELVLVDYDGVFVPELSGQPMPEAGMPGYQHPARAQAPFDQHLDDFSILVILLSLRALALAPSLKERFPEQDNLLLTARDLENPTQSPLIQHLQTLPHPDLQTLLGLLLVSLAQNRSIQVIGLEAWVAQTYQEINMPAGEKAFDLAEWKRLPREWKEILWNNGALHSQSKPAKLRACLNK